MKIRRVSILFMSILSGLCPIVFASEIHEAVLAGDRQRAAALLDKDPGCVNEKNENGWTPLLYAAGRAGGLDMVRLLVEHGADVNFSQKYGGSVLDRAYESGDAAVLDYLQGKGARFTPIDMRLESVRGPISRIACHWGMRNNIAVSAGPDGLLIVDSGFGKRSTGELHKMLAGMGKGDLRIIVNSHPHGDHTAGNVLAGGQTRLLDFAGLERAGQEGILAKSESPLTGAGGRSFPAYYSLSFNGESVRLIPFPGLHSSRDLLVHFSGTGVVFMGDLLLSQNCPALNLPAEYLDFLDTVLDVFPPETIFISGHGRDLSHDGVRAYRKTLQDMIDIVRRETADGKNLEQMLQEDVLKAYKAEYSFLDWLGPDTWLETAWRRLILKSAADTLERTLSENGLEAAQAEFRGRILGNKDYDLDERDINSLGYRLLQRERKIPEAVAVFSLNAEAFPESWNAWDSLGEAQGAAGLRDEAEKDYEKSLALNPRNENGREALSQLRGFKLDDERQTSEIGRFQPGEPTGLRGPYLGQEPPGLTPKIFAPGVVSTAGHIEFSQTFSPDGKEFYFTRRKDSDGRNTIMVCRLGAEGWLAPVEAELNQGFPSNEPHITPDGGRIFFGSDRPPAGGRASEYGIWTAEKIPGGWSAPRRHGPGMYVSTARNGDLYLNDIDRAYGGGIVRFPFRDGVYGEAERCGGGVNSPRPGAHACIAPDGGFIIIDSDNRPGGQGGEGDLWVCFKNPDGSWSEAGNLGDAVNTPGTNFCPSLSPDGKYLFFSTSRDIYWVSAEVIEKVRPASRK